LRFEFQEVEGVNKVGKIVYCLVFNHKIIVIITWKASLITDHASFILSVKPNIVYAGKRSNLLLAIIPIVALISVSAVLFIMIYYFHCKRAQKEHNAIHKENGTK
jgi:hypothetical protein